MTGRIFEAGHTTAPDHMPERLKIPLASKGASTHVHYLHLPLVGIIDDP